MTSCTTALASVSDGDSSARRSHSSAIWDWRSATGRAYRAPEEA